jgi:hypothetical protein
MFAIDGQSRWGLLSPEFPWAILKGHMMFFPSTK